MGAFKIRGAYNMISQLTPEQLTRGVITYSSGNHGQAVAMAAQLLGAPAVIVMPTTAPKVKVEGALSYGAEVEFAGTTSTDRQRARCSSAAERGLTIVPPFDHEQIIAGQGTAGLEILEQCPEVGRDLPADRWRRAALGRRDGGEAVEALGPRSSAWSRKARRR